MGGEGRVGGGGGNCSFDQYSVCVCFPGDHLNMGVDCNQLATHIEEDILLTFILILHPHLSYFNPQPSSSSLHILTFILQYSIFQPSTSILQTAYFNLHPSTFNLHPPTFNIHPPPSNLQPSILQPPSSNLLPSSFILPVA